MKIFDSLLQATPKQWVILFLITGIIAGISVGGLTSIRCLMEETPINHSLFAGFIVFVVILSGFGVSALLMFLLLLLTKKVPQSKKIKDICAHLTKEEEKQMARFGAVTGLIIGVFFAVPLSFGLRWAFESKSPIITIIIVAWVLIGIPILLSRYRKSKELLCSTRWAKEQGYTPDKI